MPPQPIRLYLVAMLLSSGLNLAPANDPVFVPNPSTHAEGIVRSRFLSNGTELITISADKTVRVWDLTTKRVTKTIRLPISVGLEGKPMTLAITPDDKYVAVAGYGVSELGHGQIYLISLSTGKVDRVLQGHTGFVFGIAISPDGKQLASAGQDKTARVWKLETGKELVRYEGHTDIVYSVVFSPDGSKVASASLDQTAKVWSSSTREESATLNGHTDKVRGIDWSTDGKRIVTASWDKTVRVWSTTGDELLKIDTGGNAAYAVQFTADGSNVAVANGNLPGVTEDICYRLYNARNGAEVAKSKHFGAALNDVVISPDGKTAATCGGLSGQVSLLELNSGKLIGELSPASYTVTVVGWGDKNNTIYWGGSPDDPDGVRDPVKDLAARKLINKFDFHTLTLTNSASGYSAAFRNRSTIEGMKVFQPVDIHKVRIHSDGEFGVQAPDTLRSIPSLSPKNDMSVVGSERAVWLFETRTGALSKKMVSHSGQVSDAVFSADGSYILSGATDRTVRVWRKGDISPLVNLYAADGEWVAWTPEGYYASSAGGEKMVGWVVNNKPDENPTFHPAERFHDSLYRPDVIKRLLEFGNVDDALKAANQAAGRKDSKLDVTKVKPPKVEYVELPKPDRDGKVQIHVRASNTGEQGITELELIVNGRPYGADAKRPKNGKNNLEEARWSDIELLPDTENRIKVIARTKASFGASDERVVYYQSVESPPKPRLFVMTVGVSEYKDPSLNLRFCDKGADAVRSTFDAHTLPSFESVESGGELRNAAATKANLLTALDKLAKKSKASDTVVVYLAGHGARTADGSGWLYRPHDFDKSAEAKTGLSAQELQEKLAVVRGRRLVLILDACHSGAAADGVIRYVTREGHGVDLLCSSTAPQESFGNPQVQLPNLTYSLTKRLVDKGLATPRADVDNEVAIAFQKVAGEVVNEVGVLTQNKQNPFYSQAQGGLLYLTRPQKR